MYMCICVYICIYVYAYMYIYTYICGLPGGSDNKDSTCNTGDEFSTWVGKIP